ncbi:MAG: Holliday junction branch migration protein RuvA [Acidimicrobiales bacterium]
MIGFLRGTLLDRGAAEVTVDVVGVGYRVTVTPTTVVSLGDVGDEVACWIHHHQREDAQTLYGFATKDERTCFEALIGAHGVGPALALAILSVHSPIALARILAEDDLGALCLVPGVGKKTAARLLLDLKSRLSIPDLGHSPVLTGSSASTPGVGSARADVRDALAGLGYTDGEVREVMADLPDDGDAGMLLRDALQRLASARR